MPYGKTGSKTTPKKQGSGRPMSSGSGYAKTSRGMIRDTQAGLSYGKGSSQLHRRGKKRG